MVLELLNWDLSAITPYCILDQLLRRLIQPLHQIQGHFQDIKSIRNYAETLLSLAITETAFMTYSPCLVAVASLITAMSSLGHQNADQSKVANFLHNLLDVTQLNIEDVASTINVLETFVRSRIAYEQRCNKLTSRYSPPPVRTPTEIASATCVC